MASGRQSPASAFRTPSSTSTEQVVLERYLIVERERQTEYFNWFQHYSLASLKAKVQAAGLVVEDVYGDVAGESFEPSLPEFAVVVRR